MKVYKKVINGFEMSSPARSIDEEKQLLSEGWQLKALTKKELKYWKQQYPDILTND